MMKKTISAVLAAVLLLCAAGCAAQKQEESPNMQPMAPVAVTDEQAASESTAAVLPVEVPASADQAEPAAEPEVLTEEDPELFEKAQELIGAPVQALYDAIGEPQSSQYAASCETDGADDGMLFYEGFYIWTVRTDEDETVRAVYADE